MRLRDRSIVLALLLASACASSGGERTADASDVDEESSGGLDAEAVRARWERQQRAEQERERREAFMNRARSRGSGGP